MPPLGDGEGATHQNVVKVNIGEGGVPVTARAPACQIRAEGSVGPTLGGDVSRAVHVYS